MADGESEEGRRRALAAGAIVVVLVVIVLFVVLGDSGDDDEGPATRSKSGEVVSGATGETYRYPRTVEGRTGRKTIFVNEDDVAHTFTSDDGHFDSGSLDPDGEYTVETLPEGTYTFHCEIHPDLEGTLKISD